MCCGTRGAKGWYAALKILQWLALSIANWNPPCPALYSNPFCQPVSHPDGRSLISLASRFAIQQMQPAWCSSHLSEINLMMNSQVLRDQKEILTNSNIKSYTELKEVLLLLFVAPFQSTRVGPFWSGSDLWSLVTRLRHTWAASIGGGAVHQFSLKRIYTDKIFWTLALNCAHIYSQLPWLPPYLSFWHSNGLHFLEGDQTETNFVKLWLIVKIFDSTVDHQINNDLSDFLLLFYWSTCCC